MANVRHVAQIFQKTGGKFVTHFTGRNFSLIHLALVDSYTMNFILHIS